MLGMTFLQSRSAATTIAMLLMAGTATVLLPAPQAQAATVPCSTVDAIVLYTDSGFSGRLQCLDAGGGNLNSTLNDKASSIVSWLPTTICVYDGPNRTGYSMAVGPGHYFRNLSKDGAPDGRSWNDRISSVGPC